MDEEHNGKDNHHHSEHHSNHKENRRMRSVTLQGTGAAANLEATFTATQQTVKATSAQRKGTDEHEDSKLSAKLPPPEEVKKSPAKTPTAMATEYTYTLYAQGV
jgi:hypothetical protein